MKLKALHLRNGDDARLLWIVAAIVLLAGLYTVERHYQTRIGAAESSTEALYRKTAANERTVAEQTALRHVESIAERDLQHVARDLPLSMSTAEFLEMLDALAEQHGATIQGVQPLQAQVGQAEIADHELDGSPLTLHVRGRFENLLAFVSRLSHHHVLVGVDRVQMAHVPNGTSGMQPDLDATIDATLYRLQLPKIEETTIVSDR